MPASILVFVDEMWYLSDRDLQKGIVGPRDFNCIFTHKNIFVKQDPVSSLFVYFAYATPIWCRTDRLFYFPHKGYI